MNAAIPPRVAFRERSVLCAGPGGLHRMAYVEWGDPASTRVALCVHGLTRNGRDFDALAQALAAQGWRVVCPDVAGRGRSDWLTDKRGYDVPQYVADMVTLIARLDVEALHWVGTSMGGIVGMRIAGLAQTPLRSLVLNDIGPQIAPAALRRLAGHVGSAPRFADVDQLEAWMRVACAPYGALSDEQWAHLARHSLRAVDGGYALAYDPVIAEVFASLPSDGVSFWPAWDAVRCPVLVLRGAQSDLLDHATLTRMAASRPGVETAEIAGVGHAPMLMDAMQIALVSDFLDRASG